MMLLLVILCAIAVVLDVVSWSGQEERPTAVFVAWIVVSIAVGAVIGKMLA